MPKITDAEMLLQMKESINEAKTESDRLDGKIQSGLERLKAEFECDDIEAGRTKLAEMESEIKEKQEQVHVIVDTLQEKYDW